MSISSTCLTKIIFIALPVLSCLLSGCSNQKPTEAEVAGALRKEIPGYFALNRVATEAPQSASGTLILGFAADIVAKEDLFGLVQEQRWSTPTIKKMTSAGDSKTLYGRTHFNRVESRWMTERLTLDTSLEFGRPRSEFPVTAIAVGSPAFEQAVQTFDLAEQHRIAEERRKTEALAKLEAEKAEAVRQRIKTVEEAFAPGTSLDGEITYVSDRAKIRLTVVDYIQGKFLVKFTDSERDGVSQLFEGEVADMIRLKSGAVTAALVLTSRSPNNFPSSLWG